MFDIINFQKELSVFHCMFDSNNDFQKSKNDFNENEFVKNFSDAYGYDALNDIKITYCSNKNIFEINVSVLEENIRIEYLINLTTDEIQSNVSLFKWEEYNASDRFTKCYNAYKNLDSMIMIFIESNIKTLDKVANTFIEKLETNLLSDNIKFEKLSYNDLSDALFINIKDFQIQVPDFSDFIKGENLCYDIYSKDAIYSFNNQTVDLINSIVENIKKIFS